MATCFVVGRAWEKVDSTHMFLKTGEVGAGRKPMRRDAHPFFSAQEVAIGGHLCCGEGRKVLRTEKSCLGKGGEEGKGKAWIINRTCRSPITSDLGSNNYDLR